MPAGQFLVAKFAVGDPAKLTAVNVSSSPGTGGGLAANVNRWRQQLGQPPFTPEELDKAVQSIKTSSGDGALVELTGKDARTGQPAAIIGVLLIQPEQSWFYKLMGDTATVAAEREQFIQFVQEAKY